MGLIDRGKGDEAAHEDAKAAHEELLALEREIDPDSPDERPP